MAVAATSGAEFGMAMSHDTNFPTADTLPKRHAACDECRKRKLKCSGEPTGCHRCMKQSLFCHYSIQKQMGRPPKKRMRENDGINSMGSAGSGAIADLDKEWSPSVIPSESFHVCPPVYLNRPVVPGAQDSNDPAVKLDQFHNLQPISATATPWPDFSTTSAASSMLSMDTRFSDLPSELLATLGSSSETQPCPCLSYLYLCLSTLSTLNSFPVTVHTLNSLYTAARTARSVIRCEVCPQAFATSYQNIMMLGTLLSVLADAWLRVSQADAQDLGKQTAPPAYEASITQDPEGAKTTWKQWLRQVVRRAVIGGPIDPNAFPPSPLCEQTPDLLSLITELEARQRRWHAEGFGQRFYYHNNSPEKPPTETKTTQSDSDPEEEKKQSTDADQRDMFCLKVIGMAKSAIARFGFEPHEYPDGVSL
ncbi:hypothetical protein VTN77DRAFT_3061 [Rasamsonia byssochlamydoides]|uniref:uncharacterized protein n=1 Tax=Rasamsonia byssochlamydoides TaxID=89139 RepID=UPI00374243C5